jgi:hypothetical protein
VGGLVGAAVGTLKGARSPSRTLVNKIYWLAFLGLTLLNLFLPWSTPWEFGENVAIVLLGVLPGVQLGAALLSAGIVALSSHPHKPAAYRHIGRLALYTFLGALAGAALVVIFFKVAF